MPYQISWYNPQRVLLMRTPEEVSETAVREADERILSLLGESGEGRVHAIIDDSAMRRMPGVAVTMNLETLKHPRFGWTIVVGQKDKVYRMLYTITCHLRGLPLYLADTIDEATDFIKKAEA